MALDEAEAAGTQNGSALITVGWVAVILGVMLILIAAFGYDVGVESGTIDADRVINIGLLQNQLMLFQFGCAILILGTLTACTGWLGRK